MTKFQRTSQGFCTAALRGLRNLQRTERAGLAPQAQAATLAPDANFVVRNQSLIAAGAVSGQKV